MDIELIIHKQDPDAIERLREGTKSLRARGHRVSGRVTFESDDAESFAREATLRSVDLVIAAGGDGTVHQVANGILGAAPGTPAEQLPRLGIVPLGTANDFAGFLEIPGDVTEALEVAVEASGAIADAALVNGRYFVNVSVGGLGPEATEEASKKIKRQLGALAYLIGGVKTFARLEPSRARFLCGEEVVFDGDFLLYAIGNGRRTGGGNLVTPHADLADGLLDLCIIAPLSHTEFLRLLPDLRAGRHLGNEHVLYRRVTELRIESEEELSVNADGEPVDSHQLVYRVIPGAIRLAVPTVAPAYHEPAERA